MKIFSFLERQRAKRETFKRDMWALRVSLAMRPRDWEGRSHSGNRVYSITNIPKNWYIWIGNSAWGMDVKVNGHMYGGVVLFVWPWSWRRKLWLQVREAVDNERITIHRTGTK